MVIKKSQTIKMAISMHSRAFLLLRRDFINLQRFPLIVSNLLFCAINSNSPQGVSAQPLSDDLFSWGAKIEGLRGTMWEGIGLIIQAVAINLLIGGVFQIRITFSEEFNNRPPEVHFMTIPFHPNGAIISCY